MIFRNLQGLMELHFEFLKKLEAACSIQNGQVNIVEIFMEVNFLDVYGTFCSTHDRSMQTLLNHKVRNCANVLSHSLE